MLEEKTVEQPGLNYHDPDLTTEDREQLDAMRDDWGKELIEWKQLVELTQHNGWAVLLKMLEADHEAQLGRLLSEKDPVFLHRLQGTLAQINRLKNLRTEAGNHRRSLQELYTRTYEKPEGAKGAP